MIGRIGVIRPLLRVGSHSLYVKGAFTPSLYKPAKASSSLITRSFSIIPSSFSGEKQDTALFGGIALGGILFAYVMQNQIQEESVIQEPSPNFGGKVKGLVDVGAALQRNPLEGVVVPIPQGISHKKIETFLQGRAPEVFKDWKKLEELFAACKSKDLFFADPDVLDSLQRIEKGIHAAFNGMYEKDIKYLISPAIRKWLEELSQRNSYVMVRSSGVEDTQNVPNAGGNLSLEYIDPEDLDILSATGAVVASYFSVSSLRNRIESGENPFTSPLVLSVLIQELIGETVGGAKDPKEIPISLVLFTTEPTDSEGDFHVIKICSAYGHGSGIVNYGLVESDRAHIVKSEGKIIEAYQNRDKKYRLAPIRDSKTGNVKLGVIQNPIELQKQRTLSPEMVARLTQLAEYIEKEKGGPTDVEIVIKGDTIYVVQARPVIRKGQEPTYVSLEVLERKGLKLEGYPIKVLVSGKGSAEVVYNRDSLLVCDSLKEAEDTPGSKNKALVVVGVDEENTHPIVNFSALGIPCVYTKDLKELHQLVASIDAEHPLIFCPQSGKLYIWDDARVDPKECIKEGYYSHPAPLGISFDKDFPFEPVGMAKAPVEIERLLRSLKDSKEDRVARRALAALQKESFSRIEGVKRHYTVLKKELPSGVKRVEESLSQTFEEIAKTGSTKKEKLFWIKRAERLLLGQPEGSLYTYSLLDIEKLSISAEKQIAYRKGLSLPPQWEECLFAGESAFSIEGEKKWTQFLLELEKLPRSADLMEKREALKALLSILVQNHALPIFISGVCLPMLAEEKDAVKVLDKMLSMTNAKEEVFLSRISMHSQELAQIQKTLSRFEDPKTFESSWKQLSSEVRFFMRKDFMKSMREGSDLTKIAGVAALKELVDVTDLAIKSMMKSGYFSTEEKGDKLREMLRLNFKTLRRWLIYLVPKDKIIFNPEWRSRLNFFQKPGLSEYLDMMKRVLEKPSIDLSPSAGFSVNAAMIGSQANYERHKPSKLADIFTLIHQNQIFVASTLQAMLFPEKALDTLPVASLMQEARDKVKNFKTKSNLYGTEFSDTSITYHYNVPMRNHSAGFSLEQKKDRTLLLTGRFLGEARHRWGLIKKIVQALEYASDLKLLNPPELGDQEVVFTWMIRNKKELTLATLALDSLLGSAEQDRYFLKHLIEDMKDANVLPKMGIWFFENIAQMENSNALNRADLLWLEDLMKITFPSSEFLSWLQKQTASYGLSHDVNKVQKEIEKIDLLLITYQCVPITDRSSLYFFQEHPPLFVDPLKRFMDSKVDPNLVVSLCAELLSFGNYFFVDLGELVPLIEEYVDRMANESQVDADKIMKVCKQLMKYGRHHLIDVERVFSVLDKGTSIVNEGTMYDLLEMCYLLIDYSETHYVDLGRFNPILERYKVENLKADDVNVLFRIYQCLLEANTRGFRVSALAFVNKYCDHLKISEGGIGLFRTLTEQGVGFDEAYKYILKLKGDDVFFISSFYRYNILSIVTAILDQGKYKDEIRALADQWSNDVNKKDFISIYSIGKDIQEYLKGS